MTPIHSLTCLFYIMPERINMQAEQGSTFEVRARGEGRRREDIMLKLCSLTFKNYTPNPRTDFFIQKGFRVHSDHFTHKFH